MGFDFMLDADMKLYLIECNTNPCLETQTSILLQRIIPQVLDQTVKLAVDPFLRATEQQFMNAPELSLSELKYELIYEHRFGEQAPAAGQVLSPVKAKNGKDRPAGAAKSVGRTLTISQTNQAKTVNNTDEFE